MISFLLNCPPRSVKGALPGVFRLALMSFLLIPAACSSLPPHAPKATVRTPSSYQGSIATKAIKQGTSLDLSLPEIKATDSYTVISGEWDSSQYHSWRIEVHYGLAPYIWKAWQTAKDGYDANLGSIIDAGARIYPRFQRRKYPWGYAMTYLVQYQNDNTNYVPNNGMLEYEIVGFTKDHRYTIRADFSVTHPRLTAFGPKVRDYRDDTFKSDSKMRRDPDYILVEKCPGAKFQPSLDTIDAFLDTISIRG